MLSEDTRPEIEQMLVDLARRMPVARKLQLLAQMHETGRTLALTGLQHRYPAEAV